VGGEELHAVLPLGHGALWAWQARPWVMGILNVTPDSFSDGGAYLEVGARLPHAADHGADTGSWQLGTWDPSGGTNSGGTHFCRVPFSQR
jgi:hypothetical protein